MKDDSYDIVAVGTGFATSFFSSSSAGESGEVTQGSSARCRPQIFSR